MKVRGKWSSSLKNEVVLREVTLVLINRIKEIESDKSMTNKWNFYKMLSIRIV